MTNTARLTCGRVYNLLPAPGVTSVTTGDWHYKDGLHVALQATVVGTGAVSATVIIEASNDGASAVATPLGTITLTGTNADSDGFANAEPWKFIRARVSALSGTGAVVTCSFCA